MFLAVTPIEAFWDESDELLFIGSWCTQYDRREHWGRLRHRLLADPWQSVQRYEEALAYAHRVADRFLDQLSSYLNGVHGTDHDRRYWRLLLDPWLDFHVQQMYDHYVLVNEAFLIDPNLRTILLDPADYETPRDMGDFVRLMLGDRFHLQLFSHILAQRHPYFPTKRLPAPVANDSSERRMESAVTDPALRHGFKGSLKRAVAWFLRALRSVGAGEVFAVELGVGRKSLARLIVGSGFKLLPGFVELDESTRVPPAMDQRRLGLAGLVAQDDFEKVFIAGLPRHLPTIFLEGYAAARATALAAIPRAPKIFFSSLGWHYLDACKFAAAECARRGSKLWGIQHGGSYGMAATSSAELFERDLCDRYFGWGWAENDGDPRLRDLPAPQLSRRIPTTPGDDILFVSTSLDLHNIRLVRDTNGAGASDAIDRQARFLRALPEPARRHAVVRLFWHDWGWRHRERLRDLFPDARFDDPTVPLYRRIREARLVIVDIPSTPMLETLSAGIPCLMTWRPDTWTVRPSAQRFFDAFRKTGILFDSPEEAAAQAARVYPDPLGWWNEPARRAARLDFTRTFGLSDPNWISAWLKEIQAGLREPS